MKQLIAPAAIQPSTIPPSLSFLDGTTLLPDAITIGRAEQYGFTASAMFGASVSSPTLLAFFKKTIIQTPLSNICSSRSRSTPSKQTDLHILHSKYTCRL